MINKKLVGGLLSVAFVSATYAIFNNFINLNKILSDSIKQNVVYTTPKASIWSKNIVDKALVSKSEPKETNNIVNNSVQVNKVKVNDMQTYKPKVNKPIENKTPSTEAVANKGDDTKDKPKDVIDSRSQSQAMLAINKYFGISPDMNENSTNTDFKVKMVGKHEQFSWISLSLRRFYSIIYNIDNNEIEGINYMPLEVSYEGKTILSLDQCKGSAEKFIIDNGVAGIQVPKFIRSEKYEQNIYCSNFYYEDANDSSKKVNINVNIYTGEIMGFYLDSISDLKSQKDFFFYE
ncbi:hypothetical protein [Clostridium neuense]